MAYTLHEAIHNRAYTMLWNEMAYAMQYGLTPTQVDLGRTHIGGHQMKTRHLEMRACVHANRGRTLRHRNATLMRHGKDMEYGMQTCKNQWQNEGQNSPETRRNDTRCTESLPKHGIKHMKWPIDMQRMHDWYMKCEDRS